MLLLIVIVVLLLNRRRWYGYGPYWGYSTDGGYVPYVPANYGYVWNGYAWQPRYSPTYNPSYGAYQGLYYGQPYGYDRRPYGW